MFLAMGGLIALSFLAIRVLEEDVRAYRQSNQQAIHWSAAQVEVELSRFLLALSRYGDADDAVDKAEVNRRFDLLWSRTGLFRSGEIGERLRRSDQGLGAIPLTLATLQQYEESILNLERKDSIAKTHLLAEFAALQDPLRRLAVKVLAGEQARYAAVRGTLLDSSRMTFWVWAATLVLAALLVSIMFLEARRYKRLIRETARLAAEAQAANRVKSRFLTMMSHELRTPMNGVMGLMALAKQTGLSDKQLRLIEQAERSGAQMVGLLGDILDFSDLQNERLVLDNVPFQPRVLGEAVIQGMKSQSSARALNMSSECPNAVPDWVEGDFVRLRQAILHCCTYFADTVGTRDIRLVFAHDDRHLIIEIDIEAHETDQPGWQPEAIFGSSASHRGEFASDVVGPTIARGLVGVMQGTLRMRRTVPGRASLHVRVPAPEIAPQRDCIRVDTHSDTTGLLLQAAIDETVWQIWNQRLSASRVAAVLLEAADEQDARLVNRLRSEHPGAVVIGIGVCGDPSLFDAVCRVPLSPGELNDLVERMKSRAMLPDSAGDEIDGLVGSGSS